MPLGHCRSPILQVPPVFCFVCCFFFFFFSLALSFTIFTDYSTAVFASLAAPHCLFRKIQHAEYVDAPCQASLQGRLHGSRCLLLIRRVRCSPFCTRLPWCGKAWCRHLSCSRFRHHQAQWCGKTYQLAPPHPTPHTPHTRVTNGLLCLCMRPCLSRHTHTCYGARTKTCRRPHHTTRTHRTHHTQVLRGSGVGQTMLLATAPKQYTIVNVKGLSRPVKIKQINKKLPKIAISCVWLCSARAQRTSRILNLK